MYGSDCWRVVKREMAKIDAFHNGCLRKICRIVWPNKITNMELHKKTGCTSAVLEIKRRRLRWLGNVLRMTKESNPNCCPKMDTTRKKEARTTKDNMAKDSNGRATMYGALVGRWSGRSKGQDPVVEHCCCYCYCCWCCCCCCCCCCWLLLLLLLLLLFVVVVLWNEEDK